MKYQNRLTVFLPNLIMLVTILLHSTIWIGAQEVEDESEFDYKKDSVRGPSHWGELKKEWAACKSGTMQSPIDLPTQRVRVASELGNLKISYKPQSATLKNRGHDIELKLNGDAGSININGTEFLLQQFHWHSPSEHTINGIRYDLEVHLVHENPNTKSMAVVALLYKIGEPDPVLNKLSNYIKSMVDLQGEEKNIGVFDPSDIKLDGNKYYRYMGSLTVPPCTEGVVWTINEMMGSVSREQIKLLKDAVHENSEDNSRPVQPLNTRVIELYPKS